MRFGEKTLLHVTEALFSFWIPGTEQKKIKFQKTGAKLHDQIFTYFNKQNLNVHI